MTCRNLIFIALQCIAAPIALLLTRSEKVQRSDGSNVKVVHEKSVAAEIRALGRAVSRRDVSTIHLKGQGFESNYEHRSFYCYPYFGLRTLINTSEV
jgi:hypothetical protein